MGSPLPIFLVDLEEEDPFQEVEPPLLHSFLINHFVDGDPINHLLLIFLVELVILVHLANLVGKS